MALAAGITYRRVLAETSALFDYQLRQMALSLRSQVSLAPRIEVPPDQGDTDFVVQIWDLFGARMYLSRPGLPMINQTVLGYANLSVQGQAWRAYGLQTADGVIQIAQPIGVRQRLARAAALRVLIPLILLLPVLVVFVVWIVGRGLLAPAAPDHRGAAARRAEHDAAGPPTACPGKSNRLVAELNRLLERLREAFAIQQNFIADAAHELRSPLTALRLQLQLLDRAPDEAARNEARAGLGEAVERAIHLVEQLLALARSEPQEAARGVHGRGPRGAVSALAIADTHALALARGIDLGLEPAGPLWVEGDPEALRILVRNLVDNAVRYTPAGGAVRVRCTNGGRRPDCSRWTMADPGSRRPSASGYSIASTGEAAVQETGTGLGLAIVKAIAARHGAVIALADSPAGGLRVTVRFPGEARDAVTAP